MSGVNTDGHQKIIFFGVEHVLLQHDSSNFTGGNVGSWLGYTPDAVRKELMDILASASISADASVRSAPGSYPLIIKYWSLVPGSSYQVKKRALDHISKKTWLLQKARLKLAADIAFTPNQTPRALKSNTAMVNLSKQCQQKGCIISVATNWNKEGFQAIENKHKKTFGHFDHIYISGTRKLLTSEKLFFEQIIKELGVEAKHCILVDQDPDSLAAARKAGITTITYKSPAQVRNELHNHNVL